MTIGFIIVPILSVICLPFMIDSTDYDDENQSTEDSSNESQANLNDSLSLLDDQDDDQNQLPTDDILSF